MKKNRVSLNMQILIGAAAGILGGVVCNVTGYTDTNFPVFYFATLAGGIFINLLKMILIPLVFSSIAVGIANLSAHKEVNLVWKSTLIYFISTTALAVTLGLIIVNIIQPGKGIEAPALSAAAGELAFQKMSVGEFAQSFISGLFVNPITAMAENNILPTVIFAIMLGVALVIAGDEASAVRTFLSHFFKVCMIIIDWIMRLAPLGIAALLFKLTATQDASLLKAVGIFIGTVLIGIFLHGFVSLQVILIYVAKMSPLKFLPGIREALITAFATSSSSATLPVTMRCVEENLKVDKDISGFVLPLGATVNMDGTALYEAIAAIFIANVVGIELTIMQQCIVFFTAIIAAIGAPGIPSAGMVTMAMVLQSVGLPVEGIALLLPVDRLLDSFRTALNVEGDSVGSAVVERIVAKSNRSKMI